jgi:predicted small lipoprotein YifL
MIGPSNRETPMHRRPSIISLAVVLTVLAVAGCGRKGSLEPPGTVEAPPTATPTVFGTSPPPPVEAPPPAAADDEFVLDVLI